MREWLKELRTQKSLTQRELSEKLGVTQQYYNMIEKGGRQKNMDMKLALKIAEVFNVSIGYICEHEAKIK